MDEVSTNVCSKHCPGDEIDRCGGSNLQIVSAYKFKEDTNGGTVYGYSDTFNKMLFIKELFTTLIIKNDKLGFFVISSNLSFMNPDFVYVYKFEIMSS